ALRRAHPALGAGRDVAWEEAPAGVLAFRRTAAGRTLVVTTNLTGRPVTLPAPGTPLLCSLNSRAPGADLGGPGTDAVLPPDATVWWER
ncbi:DUF3459 domain-containing protein, partial [Streptomyces sp. LNU-CPARS28]